MTTTTITMTTTEITATLAAASAALSNGHYAEAHELANRAVFAAYNLDDTDEVNDLGQIAWNLRSLANRHL